MLGVLGSTKIIHFWGDNRLVTWSYSENQCEEFSKPKNKSTR